MDLIKLSKSKGFMSRDNLIGVSDDYYYLWMCELQKWLRDKHNCIVEVLFHSYTENEFFESKNDINFQVTVDYYEENFNKEQTEESDFNITHFKSYEEALEKGLQEALKLI